MATLPPVHQQSNQPLGLALTALEQLDQLRSYPWRYEELTGCPSMDGALVHAEVMGKRLFPYLPPMQQFAGGAE